MGKKILIFADGTGNEGGLLPDESRTNVYKLYRATRTGPDSRIDPENQLAFYIPGIGTSATGKAGYFAKARGIYQQATGRGLKDRIRSCYKAILSVWRPGDTIYLFGFSRGAYTVRCLAHVLELYGIPSAEPGSSSVSLDPKKLDRVAKRAVNGMYRFGFLVRDSPNRRKDVEEFEREYKPYLGKDSGALPYFVGVWDTVASYGLGRFKPELYDTHLPRDIKYVRHALSIDENRKDFARVLYGGSNLRQKQIDEHDPLQQFWFSGNHSDIGGSYPENESRLSDIALHWIVDFITEKVPVECRITYNREMLNIFPCASGIMHDECLSSKIRWFHKLRDIPNDATLHSTVLDRFAMSLVRDYGGYKPYRPERLRKHKAVSHYYINEPPKFYWHQSIFSSIVRIFRSS